MLICEAHNKIEIRSPVKLDLNPVAQGEYTRINTTLFANNLQRVEWTLKHPDIAGPLASGWAYAPENGIITINRQVNSKGLQSGEHHLLFNAVSSGGTCSLEGIDDGYQTISEWITLIVGEQYKVKVSADRDPVAPGGERTVTAQIVDQDDNPVVPENPISVTLSVAGVENSGGHIDFYHSPQTRPTGTLSAPTCTTGGDGKCQITHKAPVFSGIEEITAKITGDSDTIPVHNVEIVLSSMPPGAQNEYQLFGKTDAHPLNHYVTVNTRDIFLKINTKYHEKYPNATLWVNDISLMWGGKFDIYGSGCSNACWGDSKSHGEHRLGITMDMNLSSMSPEQQDVFWSICEKEKVKPDIHGPPAHWHIRFPPYEGE